MHWKLYLDLFFTAALAVWVAACATNPDIPIVRQIPVPEVERLSSDLPSRPLSLDRVVVEIDRGTVLGEYRRGNMCIDPQPLVWTSGSREYREGNYHTEFDRVIRQYGFRILDKPTSLFAPPASAANELIVGALVTRIQENSCHAIDIFHGDRAIYKGSASLAVRFEVFSPIDAKVLLTLDTEGSSLGNEFRPRWEHDYYSKAFGNALRVLLSNAEFRRIVFRQPGIGL